VRPRAATAAVLLGLALHGSHANAADPDPWLAKDKALHFGVSAAIAGGSYVPAAALFEARGHALLVAGGVALAAGVGKEVLDFTGYGTPSWKDLTADVAGTIVGLALAWSIDLLVRGVSDEHPLFRAPNAPRAPSPPAARADEIRSVSFVGSRLAIPF
jgi:putative lipoprotein